MKALVDRIKTRLSRTTTDTDRALSKVTPDEPGPTRRGRLSLEVVPSFWHTPAESDVEPGGRVRLCRERCCSCCRRADAESAGDPSSRPRSRDRGARPGTAERPDTTEDDEDSDEPEDELNGVEHGMSAEELAEEAERRTCFGLVTVQDDLLDVGQWGRLLAVLESNLMLAVMLTVTAIDLVWVLLMLFDGFCIDDCKAVQCAVEKHE